ncbi:MAG: hypothetical protein AB1546_00305 [bacterium]
MPDERTQQATPLLKSKNLCIMKTEHAREVNPLSPDLKDKIVKEISCLPESLLVEINEIIEIFKNNKESRNFPGRFDDVFSKISEEDAEDMLKAIEDCERTNMDDW